MCSNPKRAAPAEAQSGRPHCLEHLWKRPTCGRVQRRGTRHSGNTLGSVPLDPRLVMQDRIEQRIMHLDISAAVDLSVVADQTQFAEFVHKETDSGPGGPDHVRQCLLTDLGENGPPTIL